MGSEMRPDQSHKMLVRSNNLPKNCFGRNPWVEFEDNFQISTIKEAFTFKILFSLKT